MMTGMWGLRLALYLLFTRVIGHPEEGRYQELRRKWKTNIPLKFLAFFSEFRAFAGCHARDTVLAGGAKFRATSGSARSGPPWLCGWSPSRAK